VTIFRRPESVLVLVYTDSCNVLLLKRSKPFEIWQSVTGSLHKGESHALAAKRELREETGLTDEGKLDFTGISRQFTIDPRWRKRFAPGVVENVEYEYRYRLPSRAAIRLSAKEHSKSEWLPTSEAATRVWSWTNQRAIEDLRLES